MIDSLRLDLRYALRQLLRSPLLTLVASASLAVGIGVAAAGLSALNALLFRPLPVPEPERLLRVYRDHSNREWSYVDYQELERSGVLTSVAAEGSHLVSISIPGLARRSDFLPVVSPNYFQTLGVHMARGRTFTPGSTESEVIIAHSAWQRVFNADPRVLGRVIQVNGVPLTIIGVAPSALDGSLLSEEFGWVPASVMPLMGQRSMLEDRERKSFNLVGRLPSGVTREVAATRVQALVDAPVAQYPGDRTENARPQQVQLLTQREMVLQEDEVLAVFAIGTALVMLVLLIACINVAGLLLARALARRHEIAVRLTLGAPRRRLVMQLLTESTLIALLGGVLGCFAAKWTLDLLAAREPEFDLIATALDARVMLAALAVSVGCALAFGLVPTVQSLRLDVRSALTSVHTISAGPLRLRGTLIAVQVTVCSVLLLCALALVRGATSQERGDPGFRIADLAFADIDIYWLSRDSSRRAEFRRAARETFASTPGVSAVASAMFPPLAYGVGGLSGPVSLPDGRSISIAANVVSPNFFEVVGIPIVRGRLLRDAQQASGPEAVVNEAFADLYAGDLIGRTIDGLGSTMTVVGVVRNVDQSSIGKAPRPYVYLSESTMNERFEMRTMIARLVPGSEAAVLPMMKRRFLERFLDATPPRVNSMREFMVEQSQAQRAVARVALSAAAVELALATLGLYGLLLFALVARTREIGLRLALGAARRQAAWAAIRHGLRYTAAGVVCGFGLGVPAIMAAARMFMGTRSTDPVPFLVTALVVGVAACAAALLPAQRAARVEPAVALRHD
jgi:putative ABC transport system permease protein